MRLSALLLSALLALTGLRAADIPAVAAASDLQVALAEVATAFQRSTGRSVKLSFGSSGHLARQIAQGAPFQLFLSADEAFVAQLRQGGQAEDEGAIYAHGRLALFIPTGSGLRPDPTLQDLGAALRDGRLTRFAIANPIHAPYGQRAEAILRGLGLWEALRPRLVMGENVAQAAQFAASGNAQGGLVAASLAQAPAYANRGSWTLLPESSHPPLVQRMVLLRGAGATARAFYAFLKQTEARALLARHGFRLPGAGR